MSDTTDSELNIAEPEDFFVTRDSDDELQPVTQPLPGVEEQIRVVPMTMGDLNAYGASDGNLNPAELTNDEIAMILNEHWYDVRERDDFEVTADKVDEDMIAFGYDGLINAILQASGFQIQQGLNMENLEMLNEVDPGKLEKMMEIADKRS